MGKINNAEKLSCVVLSALILYVPNAMVFADELMQPMKTRLNGLIGQDNKEFTAPFRYAVGLKFNGIMI